MRDYVMGCIVWVLNFVVILLFELFKIWVLEIIIYNVGLFNEEEKNCIWNLIMDDSKSEECIVKELCEGMIILS